MFPFIIALECDASHVLVHIYSSKTWLGFLQTHIDVSPRFIYTLPSTSIDEVHCILSYRYAHHDNTTTNNHNQHEHSSTLPLPATATTKKIKQNKITNQRPSYLPTYLLLHCYNATTYNHKSTGARRQYPANGTTHSWKVRHSPEAAAFSRSLKGRVRTATNTDPQSSRIQPLETLETLLRLICFPLWVFACYLWNHLNNMPESMENGWLRELLIIPNWCIASLNGWVAFLEDL